MEPVLRETLTDEDTEFDLDVKLEAVARHVSADPGKKPPDDTSDAGTCGATCPAFGCD
jgi:hypothetical protein